MEYLSTKEIADKWGITSARVSSMCAAGKITGAYKKGKTWVIPSETERPRDKRINSEKQENYKFTFIDLFAGIGGFHQAMRYLGGKCIMASEINAACIETYKLNYKTKDVRGDIRKIEADSIGKFDVLCAGFPCQPFSKAGQQKGFDEDRGNLFFNIMRILDGHPEAKFIILDATVKVGDLIDTIEYDYPAFHLSMDCFWCEVASGELKLLEAEAARWLTKEELDSVQWLPADVTLIDKIRSCME